MVNEGSGLLPSDNEVTIAMSAFGQGIGVTQIQMLRAFSAISNKGVMLEPQLLVKSTTQIIIQPVKHQLKSLVNRSQKMLPTKHLIHGNGWYRFTVWYLV